MRGTRRNDVASFESLHFWAFVGYFCELPDQVQIFSADVRIFSEKVRVRIFFGSFGGGADIFAPRKAELIVNTTLVVVDITVKMIVIVAFPKRLLHPSSVEDEYRALYRKTTSRQTLPTVLRIHRTRLLWTALQPCLLHSDTRTARRLLSVILNSPTVNWSAVIHQARSSRTFIDDHLFGGDHGSASDEKNDEKPTESNVFERRLRVSVNPDHCRSDDGETSQTLPAGIVLWIETRTGVPLEDAFMGRLIAWEHNLIRAQSVTGYLATLGGGFFLCQHFQTAVVLAQQQQKLALLLNNKSMYYQCILNSAYNHIYAGYFGTAIKLIKQVLKEAKVLFPPDPVLVAMCYSAALFCKRMKRAAKMPLPQTTGAPSSTRSNENSAVGVSKTADDFARIRIARDQSRQDDLVVPFGSHNVH